MLLLVLDLPGRWRICAICDADGEAQALTMLTPGGPEDQHAGSKRQMLAHLGHVAQLQYPARNTTVSHQLDEEFQIYEFIKGDLRVAYFYDEGMTIVLSHGFIKEGKKTKPSEIVRARKAVTAYFEAKKKGYLRLVREDE